MMNSRISLLTMAALSAIGSAASQAFQFAPIERPRRKTPPVSRPLSRGYCTPWKDILKGRINGKRECARRVRQMQRSAAKAVA